MRKEITKETIEKVFKDFNKHFNKKGEKKGMGAFFTPLEAFGKLTEEYNEVLWEAHAKNWDDFRLECFDLAVTALFAVMSMEQK